MLIGLTLWWVNSTTGLSDMELYANGVEPVTTQPHFYFCFRRPSALTHNKLFCFGYLTASARYGCFGWHNGSVNTSPG